MARLPTPGGDDGTWGSVLNDYLAVSHGTDGTLKASTVGASQLKSGAIDDSKVAAGANIAQSKIANLSSTLAGKYTLPAGGIPSTDLESSVQSDLTKANNAYVKPAGGIPATDMTSAVQADLTKANAAYSKPAGGIPSTDLSSTVQTSLSNADSAYQKPAGGIPSSDFDSTTQDAINTVASGSFITGDGIAKVTVSSTAPTSPNVGDVWIAT